MPNHRPPQGPRGDQPPHHSGQRPNHNNSLDGLPTTPPEPPLLLPLPSDIRSIIGSKSKDFFNIPDNLGLLFHRFAAIWGDMKFQTMEFCQVWQEKDRKGKPKKKTNILQLKDYFFGKTAELSKNIAKSDCPGGRLLKALSGRQQVLIASLEKQGYLVRHWEQTLENRLVTGLGSGHPSEAGFAFHSLYGLPCLAASGLKGLARAAGTVLDDSFKEEDCQLLFGSPEKDPKHAKEFRQGRLLFFDAFPTSWQGMEVDILNPHYPDYYQEKAPPTEWQSPNPVKFLGIPAGTTFGFMLAVATRTGESKEEAQKILEKGTELLQQGLAELGFGGKKSSGYGLFLPPRSNAPQSRSAVEDCKVATLFVTYKKQTGDWEARENQKLIARAKGDAWLSGLSEPEIAKLKKNSKPLQVKYRVTGNVGTLIEVIKPQTNT